MSESGYFCNQDLWNVDEAEGHIKIIFVQEDGNINYFYYKIYFFSNFINYTFK